MGYRQESSMWSSSIYSSDSVEKRATPIYLNVYDVTPLNSYLYWLGLGVFHSGIEVHGVEYAFGAHEYPSSGIFEVEPQNCPGFMFRRTITLGTTDKGPEQVRELIEQLSLDYTGDSYHLIAKNCNHFTNDVCMKLTKKSAPGWVNRLAYIGAFCSCLLPESLQLSSVKNAGEYRVYGENGDDDFQGVHQIVDDDQEQQLLKAPNGILQSKRVDDAL
ncbi:hypothetical protein KP509_19G021800 [Ceratopteris richardii]|uniref:PPPDE domain-containing protein n=1 Tax=Ceratopteris richardii TaxID=49495 RepID=A0A8T2SIQ0_CERRI|nr:hypothetical protein KP509_19G021800 [Ceratopteris richardii]